MAVSSSALAGAGLGVSVQSGDPTIFVPVDVGPKFRIESFVFYSHDKSEERLYDPPSPYTLEGVNEATTYELGLGLFGLAPTSENSQVYYGGRLSYRSIKCELRYEGTRQPGLVVTNEETKFDGAAISAVLGFEYRFTEHFSVGGEASITAMNLEGDRDESLESTDTDTNVIFRYRF
ncbi:MAG TPA: outer membrane beta-barrel protein [Steroidobacteraceae bacterium]|nr:outer membrane beta-barrel protein [Steroidobacteraceae bacterium]